MIIARVFVMAFSTLVSGTIQAQDNLSVEQAWARESPPGSPNGAVYFTVKNSGAVDKLIGVGISSGIADRAELHTHKHEDGMMRMQKVEAIEVPENDHAMLKPHGGHVMLIGLKQLLQEGESITLELRFEKAGTMNIEVPVLKESPSDHSHSSGG